MKKEEKNMKIRDVDEVEAEKEDKKNIMHKLVLVHYSQGPL